MKTSGKWLYVATDTYSTDHGLPHNPAPNKYFITEDNGKTFKELINPNINITGIGEYSYETDTLDKYLSLDYENSIRSALKTKLTSNPKYYYQSGFLIKDILSNIPDTSENMIQIIGNTVEKYNNKELYATISQDYSSKFNQLIFMCYDNFAAKSLDSDSIYSKTILWEIKNRIPIIILKRNVKRIDSVSQGSPTQIVFFDRYNGYLYVEISKPIAGIKKRIIIRKKLQDPSRIETESKKLETINLTDNKLTFNKEIANPKLKIYDILSKEINYKITSNSPLTIELDQNISEGCYLLTIEENLISSYYKFVKY